MLVSPERGGQRGFITPSLRMLFLLGLRAELSWNELGQGAEGRVSSRNPGRCRDGGGRQSGPRGLGRDTGVPQRV